MYTYYNTYTSGVSYAFLLKMTIQKSVRSLVYRGKYRRLLAVCNKVLANLTTAIIFEDLPILCKEELTTVREEAATAAKMTLELVYMRLAHEESETANILWDVEAIHIHTELVAMEGEDQQSLQMNALFPESTRKELYVEPVDITPTIEIATPFVLSSSLIELWEERISERLMAVKNFAVDPIGIQLATSIFAPSTRPVHAPIFKSVVTMYETYLHWLDTRTRITRNCLEEVPEEPTRSRSVHLPDTKKLSSEEVDLVERYSQGLRASTMTALDLSVEGHASVSFLCHFTQLHSLSLNVNKLSHLNEVACLSCLMELSVKDNMLVDISALVHLTSLRTLQLDMNRLEDLDGLCHLDNLRHLSAKSNKLSNLPIFPQAIERLELYQNQLCRLSRRSFSRLHSLLYLDLGRNRLESLDADVLRSCPLLSHLVLSQNRLTTLPLLQLPLLRTLWLSGNAITSFSSWHENRIFVFLPMLERLFLQDNNIHDIATSALSLTPLLRELDLSFNSLAMEEAVEGIAHVGLRRLCIHDNPLCSQDAIVARVLAQCPALTELNGTAVMKNPTLRVPEVAMDADSNRLMHALSGMRLEQSIAHARDKARSKQEIGRNRALELAHKLLQRLLDPGILRGHNLIQLDPVEHANGEYTSAVEAEHQDIDAGVIEEALPISDAIAEAPAVVTISQECLSEAIQASVQISKLFRGYAVRRSLRRALASVEYLDADLDELMQIDLMLLDLQAPTELEAGWLQAGGDAHLVYPVRKRYVTAQIEGHSEQALHLLGAGSVDMPRPSSSATDCSILSASSEARSEKPSIASSVSLSEWGIKNPDLLATLARRNKRMRQFSEARGVRERALDPEVRFKKFAKNASQSNAPLTSNGGNLGRQRAQGRGQGRRAVVMPAWAIGQQDILSDT
jgi:Leucine-rich repeat (LRR) protein